MAELNKVVAARLWEMCDITVDRFHAKIVKHDKSIFLGYADITIDIPKLEGFTLKLRGINVKVLKGEPFLDMPSEKGADGEFYPTYFPKKNELRAVLTTAIFKDQRVLDTIEAAAQAPVEAEEQPVGTEALSADNPFVV